MTPYKKPARLYGLISSPEVSSACFFLFTCLVQPPIVKPLPGFKAVSFLMLHLTASSAEHFYEAGLLTASYSPSLAEAGDKMREIAKINLNGFRGGIGALLRQRIHGEKKKKINWDSSPLPLLSFFYEEHQSRNYGNATCVLQLSACLSEI